MVTMRYQDYLDALTVGDAAKIAETASAYAGALSEWQSLYDTQRENDIQLQRARASLTDALDDDVAAARALVELRKEQLAEAEASQDAGRIANAIDALTAATRDVEALTGAATAALPSVITFGSLPENVLRGLVTPGQEGRTVEVNQYFTQAPTDPYTWMRSADFAARSVF